MRNSPAFPEAIAAGPNFSAPRTNNIFFIWLTKIHFPTCSMSAEALDISALK